MEIIVGSSIAFVLGVMVPLGWGYLLTWKRDRLLPRILDKPSKFKGCAGSHSWLSTELRWKASEEGKVYSICTECGIVAGEDNKILNSYGMEGLCEFQIRQKKDEMLMRDTARRLNFDMSGYYNDWVGKNKESLMELLKDTHKVEKLHMLLNNFLTQGHAAARSFQEKILEELRNEGGE